MNFTFIFYNKKKKKNVRTFNLAIKNVNYFLLEEAKLSQKRFF